MIEGVGQIHISVADIERSVEYYRDVLGIPLLFQVPGQSMAFFDCGGVRLYLGPAESEEFRAKVVLYLTVDDIEAEHRRLTDGGVRFLEDPHVVHRADGRELWIAFFVDPDGHHLALMEERPEPSG